jgi:cytochrome c553
MKRILPIAMMFLATAGFAAAQTDVLGAHLNQGRGCAGCHAPHSGAFGNGMTPTVDVADTGTVALWGQDVSSLLGQTLSTGGGAYPITFPSTMVGGSSNPNVMDVLLCLSCHDGNTTSKGAMMTGTVYESLPSTYTGSGKTVPTFLGNDGTGSGNYANDHPVGPSAKFSCNAPTAPALYSESGYNWDCEGLTFTLGHSGSYSVKVTPGPNMASFINNYGFFVSLVSTDGANAYVVCTTCHNQHVMNVVNVTPLSSQAAAGTAISSGASGLSGQYKTMFFLRGPYNPNNTSSNSAAQFCRQCHGGESNEMNGVNGVVTTD